MAEAVGWGERGARINTISPGIIITPLANDELKGPCGPGYRRMLEVSAAGRAGSRTKSERSEHFSWELMAHSSPAATSSWMAR
jgi:NAD(P)-dependent dehydrogenase (short-subunit alcohol dehydrogenase family)